MAKRRFAKAVDLQAWQLAYFRSVNRDAREMHYDLARHGLFDWYELTAGQPTGRARKQLLRRLGGPFGRGPVPGGQTVMRSQQRRRGTGGRADLPLLPIGIISGRLRRSIRLKPVSIRPAQKFDVGPRGAGRSAWVLVKGGTRKMVARGLDAEIKRRWRPRNGALLQVLKERQANP